MMIMILMFLDGKSNLEISIHKHNRLIIIPQISFFLSSALFLSSVAASAAAASGSCNMGIRESFQ